MKVIKVTESRTVVMSDNREWSATIDKIERFNQPVIHRITFDHDGEWWHFTRRNKIEYNDALELAKEFVAKNTK